jgi:hypothetical protein
MDPSCGYQMLWSLILIRFQSYEAIPLVIAFPTFSQRTDEDNSDISRIFVQNKCHIFISRTMEDRGGLRLKPNFKYLQMCSLKILTHYVEVASGRPSSCFIANNTLRIYIKFIIMGSQLKIVGPISLIHIISVWNILYMKFKSSSVVVICVLTVMNIKITL